MGETLVPLPPTDDILASYDSTEGFGRWDAKIGMIINHRMGKEAADAYPETMDEFRWNEALTFHRTIKSHFPSVNWLLPEGHRDRIIQTHEAQARSSMERLSEVRNLAALDPSSPLIAGSLHEALRAYEEHRRKEFTRADGTFDNSGHHMVGLVQGVRERSTDVPLMHLDFARCQGLVDIWRERPVNARSGDALSRKTCGNYVGEIKRFFAWLHLTPTFAWRKPPDLDSLNIKIRSLPSDRPSMDEMSVPTFSVKELGLLYKHAIPSERLLMVWCLNCAHGAAEFGRVEWGDLFLGQEHPWQKSGLDVKSSDQDNWVGFLRPKSDVLGWWWLWPETVGLIRWWRTEWRRNLRREPAPRIVSC